MIENCGDNSHTPIRKVDYSPTNLDCKIRIFRKNDRRAFAETCTTKVPLVYELVNRLAAASVFF